MLFRSFLNIITPVIVRPLMAARVQVHEVYKQRSTSETWIEQVKTQLLAGATLTDNFHANDILWQLSVLAYNLSVMLRANIKDVWREEHVTFRDWFIKVPALVVRGGRCALMRVYECYIFKQRWQQFANQLDRKSTRLNSSHTDISRMPSSA